MRNDGSLLLSSSAKVAQFPPKKSTHTYATLEQQEQQKQKIWKDPKKEGKKLPDEPNRTGVVWSGLVCVLTSCSLNKTTN